MVEVSSEESEGEEDGEVASYGGQANGSLPSDEPEDVQRRLPHGDNVSDSDSEDDLVANPRRREFGRRPNDEDDLEEFEAEWMAEDDDADATTDRLEKRKLFYEKHLPGLTPVPKPTPRSI